MYSNLKNSDKDRVEDLENTIQAIYDIMKHLGCDMSDKDKMPINQFVGREISIARSTPCKECQKRHKIESESQDGYNNAMEIVGF